MWGASKSGRREKVDRWGGRDEGPTRVTLEHGHRDYVKEGGSGNP